MFIFLGGTVSDYFSARSAKLGAAWLPRNLHGNSSFGMKTSLKMKKKYTGKSVRWGMSNSLLDALWLNRSMLLILCRHPHDWGVQFPRAEVVPPSGWVGTCVLAWYWNRPPCSWSWTVRKTLLCLSIGHGMWWVIIDHCKSVIKTIMVWQSHIPRMLYFSRRRASEGL